MIRSVVTPSIYNTVESTAEFFHDRKQVVRVKPITKRELGIDEGVGGKRKTYLCCSYIVLEFIAYTCRYAIYVIQ